MNYILSAQTKQDDYFVSNISNMVDFARFKHCEKFTDFLDERQQTIALHQLKHMSYEAYSFFGGADFSERKMLGVFDVKQNNNKSFPITAIKVNFPANAKISHRDCLGAIMGLQISRDCIGDIVVSENEAVIFFTNEIVNFVISNLDKIGKFPVVLSISSDAIVEKKQEFLKICGTISSLRLDCIVALAVGKSRKASSQIIQSRLVKVNYFDMDNVSHIIKANDIISIRGYGKFVVLDDMKLTKKYRLFVAINKLL